MFYFTAKRQRFPKIIKILIRVQGLIGTQVVYGTTYTLLLPKRILKNAYHIDYIVH